MVDYVKIHAKSGHGGSGAVSFRRARGSPYGPPDGGDGGDGGDVYLTVDKDLTTLLPYRFKKDFKAEDGTRGGKNHKKGAAGESLYLSVPAGTKVTNGKNQLVADLTKAGETVMVVKGGRGGRGNAHVKRSDFSKSQIANRESISDKRQATSIWSWHEEGEEGQEIGLTLELKLLADVGIIGLPNAGKSTLLSKLTAAQPKIAAYPFTTLEPNLGVMRHKGKELVLADIPGLIEGASKGKGLGDLFLRHIERTRMLVHLVSVEVEKPLETFSLVNKELGAYSVELKNKPQVTLLTKIDILNKEELKNKIDQFKNESPRPTDGGVVSSFSRSSKNKNIKVIPISSVTGVGLESLKDELIEKF